MADVVVVDDSVMVLDTVAAILGEAGHRVTLAHDGVEGMHVVRSMLPDLVIADVIMPSFDGLKLLQHLRGDPSTAHLPVILLSGRTERRDVRRGMEAGADDYLTKPFGAHELLSAVDAQLRKRSHIAASYENTLQMLRRNIIYALPHELRTALTGSLGYAELLRADYATFSPAEVKEIATIISRYGMRLHRIIENYLVYAQIELALSNPDQREALRSNFVRHVADVVEEVAVEAAQIAGRELDLTLDLDDVILRISEGDLRKITGELVDNAFKFSEHGTTVLIRGFQQGARYVLAVHDGGRGMAAEQVRAVGAYMQFERNVYEQQGLGLGLIIARRLTELHDGTFSIESRRDVGTRVRVSFPLY